MNYLTSVFICAAFPAILAFTSFYEKTFEKIVVGLIGKRIDVLRNLFGCSLCFSMQFSFIYSFFYLGFVFEEAFAFSLIASLSSFVIYKLLDLLERL